MISVFLFLTYFTSRQSLDFILKLTSEYHNNQKTSANDFRGKSHGPIIIVTTAQFARSSLAKSMPHFHVSKMSIP